MAGDSTVGIRVARSLLVVLGGLLVVSAWLVDALEWGRAGSFGRGQWLLLVAGLLLMLSGALGRRMAALYQGVGLTLLGTLLALGALELVAILVIRSGLIAAHAPTAIERASRLPYYTGQSWAASYWREASLAEVYRYDPYVTWRHAPFEGETINVTRGGLRRTPGADCGDPSYTVLALGGSTMWGWGSPDWETIPAHLQKGFATQRRAPVCVVNLGEDAFVSTQGVIELLKRLQIGEVPSLVVFYDGVNDVYAAWQSCRAGVHPELGRVAARFEEPDDPLVGWMKTLRLYALTRNLRSRFQGARGTAPSGERCAEGDGTREALADSVVSVYLGNLRTVRALAREYGFEALFVWQPYMVLGDKLLTEEERALVSTLDPALQKLFREVHARLARQAGRWEELWDITSVFDNVKEQVWVDEWGHVTPLGNRLVAERILAASASN